jgi:hypothetical protein
MSNFYNFYPIDETKTIADIPASEVASILPENVAADQFGCYETSAGLYVPTLSVAEAQKKIDGSRLAHKNFVEVLGICGVDIFGEKIKL